MNYLGDFFEDSAVQVPFSTNDAAGGAVAPSSAFEAADIKIYKDGSDAQKITSNGVTMSSPFDSIVGLHNVAIDTSNNTGDVGFWATGSDYKVVLEPDETVDGQTIVSVIGEFSIENRNMRGTDSAATAAALTTHDSNLATVDGKIDTVQADLDDPDQYKADVSALALEATSQDILAQITGIGNRVITINVKDQDTNNLQDVLVRIGTASVPTDVSGNAVFALDDGGYDVILRKAYVSFTVPETLTVSGDGTHNYSGTLLVPSLPTQPDTCMVFGVVIDDGGFPVPGASIFINETDNTTFANTQKVVKNRQTTSDDDGFWELEIIRSSQLIPVGSPYDAIITHPNGFKYETTITVPDEDSKEFSLIAGT